VPAIALVGLIQPTGFGTAYAGAFRLGVHLCGKNPVGTYTFFQLHLFWHLFGWLLASFDFVLAATPTHFADSWIIKFIYIWVFTLICLALVFSQLYNYYNSFHLRTVL